LTLAAPFHRRHSNGVVLPAVKVTESAAGAIGGASVGVAIQTLCRGNVHFSTLGGSPVDKSHITMALKRNFNATGRTRTWRGF